MGRVGLSLNAEARRGGGNAEKQFYGGTRYWGIFLGGNGSRTAPGPWGTGAEEKMEVRAAWGVSDYGKTEDQVRFVGA
jgi:hypothetical protein